MDFEKELNEKQLEAVTTPYQHVRVVAGAGSGKTRVLTYRIAYLISKMDVPAWSILAITFTNKVANEMKNRVVAMIPDSQRDLTIKTFHSFAANFLRHEISVLGFPSSFTILDEEDQTKLLKDIAALMGYKRNDKIVGQAKNYIAFQKLHEKYPDDIKIINPHVQNEKECLEIYTRYEEEKDKILSLDFDDLLLKTNYILENYHDIRIKWQNRIGHILVDEFQDTNNIEFKLIQLLTREDTFLYVVGDPDQTIYTWRGANQNIMLKLEDHFRNVQTIVLDRNYRSTQNILNTANTLIDHNSMRLKKDLYTVNEKGDPIHLCSCPSGKAEADFVTREIKKLKATEGYHYRDIVLLYRSNYITVDFEQALTAHGIPYRIYGGTKFYQRREIKDVLAYFHLITNTKDDISFERIMNVPKRGIGDNTIALIKAEAITAKQSLYDYIRDVDIEKSIAPSKAINSLKAMIKVIDHTREEINKNEETFSKILEEMISSFNYYDYLSKEDDGDERIDNVKALFEDIRHFLKENPESTFDEYLQNIALLSAQDELSDGDFVTLMTVHTAKGLEFPVVFVVRFNQGVFPNNRALLEDGYKAIEEERRLAYVAYTRAKEKLYISYANDYSYTIGGSLTPSNFIKESGLDYPSIGKIKPYARPPMSNRPNDYNPYKKPEPRSTFNLNEPIRQNFQEKTNGITDWKVGDIVIHKTLGRGVVVSVEGDDIIKVNFEEHGLKTLLSTHPSISKGGNEA